MLENQEDQNREEMPEESEEVPSSEVPEVIEAEDVETEEVFGEEEREIGLGGRMAGIFLDPGRITGYLGKKPDWLIPFIIVILATAFFNFMANDAITRIAEDRARASMEKRNMSTEQVDKAIEMQQKFMTPPIMAVQGAVGAAFMIFVMTLVLLFLGNIIFGGSKKFKHYLALSVYAGLIGAVGTIIMAFMVKAKGDLNSAQLGLGIITANDPDSRLHKIFQQVTIFSVWQMIVYGIGLSSFTKASRGKTITVLMVLFLIFITIAGFIS